ncbi:MAG: hypothetical protein EG822_01190 [Deltaproteobacteria bacterium]|nr:hypothetical protein [Deltaproteobacteria bacterium]TLN04796.1 MAG: hypothetical protein FDZ73_02110 [bacterium]
MAIEPISTTEKVATMPDQLRKSYQSTVPQQQQAANAQHHDDLVAISVQGSSSTIGRLGTFHEEKNLQAKSIRSVADSLAKVSDVVGEMNQTLAKIVKNYPPFPPDSSERKDLLMSYISLRKEILGMTFPPPPQPLYEKNTSLWDKLGAAENGNIASSLPQLSASASDAEVIAASKAMTQLGSVVTTAQSELVGFVTA